LNANLKELIELCHWLAVRFWDFGISELDVGGANHDPRGITLSTIYEIGAHGTARA
jgi:hypothetical protein